MTRRRELKGIAGDLLGSFVSRNNDVDGYWAIGKLCAHALLTPPREVCIDLLSRRLIPPHAEFDAMVDQYASRLATSLEKRSFPIQWVTAAEVLFSIGPRFEPAVLRSNGELPYRCTVTLTDDRLRRHSVQHSGEVWPHNPARESRSLRGGIER